jgi:antitoxin HicB
MVNIDEVLKKPYSRLITPDPEGGFTGEIVEFPGCVTQGETVEETHAHLEDAARNWLEAVIEEGQVVPEPLAAADEFSGKVVLRLPKSLHCKASRYAVREGVSLNALLVTAVAQYVGERAVERSVVNNVTEVRVVDVGKRRRGSTLMYAGVESTIAPGQPSAGLLLQPKSRKSDKLVKKR